MHITQPPTASILIDILQITPPDHSGMPHWLWSGNFEILNRPDTGVRLGEVGNALERVLRSSMKKKLVDVEAKASEWNGKTGFLIMLTIWGEEAYKELRSSPFM